VRQPTLFDSERLNLDESINLTIGSLNAYGPRYEHWAIAYSGGKDSSVVASLVPYLIRTGRVQAPKRLTICYADTRMELPPLADAASKMLARQRAEGFETCVSVAPMDERFFVKLLGYGYAPPNNATRRWCTRLIKVKPMHETLKSLHGGDSPKILMLTGVRTGESTQRDQRIAISCGRNGAECGQGWFQETLPGRTCDALAPILHWRVCLVWDWLTAESLHGYPTLPVAVAYGLGDEGSQAELNARTGCTGCPLVKGDSALDLLLRSPRWSYLAPLQGLRPIYRWLEQAPQRLRQPGGEARKDGSLCLMQNRMGPTTLDARREALASILAIQAECNALRPDGIAPVDILNTEEIARIEELIAMGAMPRKWAGTEDVADQPYELWYADGSVQTLLPILY
jgi:DNA sulfur modification protein DndC